MKHQHLTKLLVVGTLVLGVAAPSAYADVVLSNLSGELSDCQTGIAGFMRAEQFTTGSGGPYVLNSVTFKLVDAAESDTYTTTLNADGGSEPGAVLATIGSADFTGSMSDVEFVLTPASEIILESNTTYWLVSQASSDSCLAWLSDVLPTGQFTFDNSLYTFDSGTTWSNDGLASIYAIDASAQEVPSLGAAGALVLALLLAGVGLFTLRRSKTRRAAMPR